jgi:hypothetical protein
VQERDDALDVAGLPRGDEVLDELGVMTHARDRGRCPSGDHESEQQ